MDQSSAAQVDEVFVQCCGRDGVADFRNVATVFWPVLENKLSLIDLAGIFTMTTPHNSTVLDSLVFPDFFGGVARMKFPTGGDFVDKLLESLKVAKGLKIRQELPLFVKAMDKHVIRELLRFDIPLRRAFSSFAGQSITIGGGLTWDEVKRHTVGMEVGGFTSFAGAYSLIPSTLTLQKCEVLAREVLSRYPLIANSSTLNTALLYPQFQLLLCSVAMERSDVLSYKDLNASKFAKKSSMSDGASISVAATTSGSSSKALSDLLVDLIRALGIDKSLDGPGNESRLSPTKTDGKILDHPLSPSTSTGAPRDKSPMRQPGSRIVGVVTMPTSTRPEDAYSSSMNHGRHAQLLRMEHLFEEIETKMLEQLGPGSEVVALLASTSLEEKLETRSRLSSKPVVVGDAVPVPAVCPEPVEQLLQAALAHHNLGTFEESLKFMEAARMQLEDMERRAAAQLRRAQASSPTQSSHRGDALSDAPQIPLDLELYITLCKGNVYQSCGDDEQSLLHYMDGWAKASARGDRDWEIVCLNSIGMLAYYSLRYDVALLCFAAVAEYRSSAYGLSSADTATAWNNEGCCLFCLQRKGESRLRFEKAWGVMCKVLGHRAPRSVAVWKNLEKARRSGSSAKGQMSEIVSLRPDISKLIIGGTFQINAVGPPVESKGGKKGGKKGTGKKR